MNPYSTDYAPWRRLLTLVIVIAAVAAVINIVLTVRLQNSTSKVTIVAASKDAAISISQNNKNAEVIGKGSVTVRLHAGRYALAASSNGTIDRTYTTVQAKHPLTVRIPKTTKPPLPSAQNIEFSNMEELVKRGLTTAQNRALQSLFFDYNPQAKKVSVLSSSVTTLPRNPSSNDPFGQNFQVAIDGTTYRATISYTGLEDMQLKIYDSKTGAELFSKNNSAGLQTPSPDN